MVSICFICNGVKSQLQRLIVILELYYVNLRILNYEMITKLVIYFPNKHNNNTHWQSYYIIAIVK